MFYGHVPITEVIPEGNYTLRAYTRYMENLGGDYFFKKNIRIGNINGGNNNCELQITNYEGNRRRDDFDVSFFSVAITDNADLSIDSLNTITASLLLSSELRGYIESPDYYLQDHREAAYALDHLMITHGWRRYELTEVIKGHYSHLQTGFELAKEISGSVKAYLTGRPVANRQVMLVSNDQSLMQTTTDSVGQFRFELHYPDSSSFFVMANNRGRIGNEKIALNPDIFPTGFQIGPMSTGLALIYIDGIESTVDDLNQIPPKLIESIDVFKEVGASIFGVRGANGAISVTTGIASDNSKNLRSNTITVSPLGYQKPVEFYSPTYDTQESRNFGIPDYRTTIYWKPDLLVLDDDQASFEFYTSDFPTTYSVVIEGITNEGKIIRQVETIEVR